MWSCESEQDYSISLPMPDFKLFIYSVSIFTLLCIIHVCTTYFFNYPTSKFIIKEIQYFDVVKKSIINPSLLFFGKIKEIILS